MIYLKKQLKCTRKIKTPIKETNTTKSTIKKLPGTNEITCNFSANQIMHTLFAVHLVCNSFFFLRGSIMLKRFK